VSAADLALLQALPGLAFQAVLLFCRVGSAMMLMPGLGEAEIPAPLRLAIALALVVLLLPGLAPSLPAMPEAPAEALPLLAMEIAIGLWLGTLARLIVLALSMAGQAIAAMVGLAGMLVADPALGPQGTALGRAFGLLAATLVLATGLHGLALRALAESYAVLPAGDPFPAGAAAEAVAMAGGASFDLALRLSAPFVMGAVVLNVALGLLARLAPQVQTFFIAVPGQILAGLALLMLLAAPMLMTFEAAVRASLLAMPGAR
jgi:flagellar biosynthetic protein FliR